MENNNNNQQSHEHHVASTLGRAARPLYPPGYRFMPTDEELIIEYLFKKVKNKTIQVAEIHEVNLYVYTPKHLAENYLQLGDNEWYFFTPRDRKYPKGNRPSRSVEEIGYWKASGVDTKIISADNGKVIGFKKALVFYEGKPKSKNTKKTNWIMHEYRLNTPSRSPSSNGMRLDDWVLCRIYQNVKRSNKKQKVVDDRVVEDDDNPATPFFENNNIEDLAAPLNFQHNNNNNILSIEQNHDHGLMMMNNSLEDNVYYHEHQFPANYRDIGINQAVHNSTMVAPSPSHHHDMNDFYGQNSGILYDDQIMNGDQQAMWPPILYDSDWGIMGNNHGTDFHEQEYPSSDFDNDWKKYVDDLRKADQECSSNDGRDGQQSATPRKRRNSEG